MPLSRAPLCYLLLAAGIACGYKFLRSPAPVPGSRVVIQDSAGPALPLFPDPNLTVNREQITSANTEARSDELKAAPTPSSGQDLALAVQKELSRAGCYEGVADGSWDQRSKIAMKQFLDRVNARLPVDRPDGPLLALVRSMPGSVCVGPASAGGLAPNVPSLDASPTISHSEKAPGAMGLGGPIMVPVGTITEAEQLSPQTVTVVAPTDASQQAEDGRTPVRIRSAPRSGREHESASLLRHPLGF